jgi:hypothetical protein
MGGVTADVAATRMEQELSATLSALFAYCQANNWAGYDPYDALNSRLLESVSLFRSKTARLIVTQTLKRSPINLRKVLQVPETQNPKGIALFLAAMLRVPGLSDGMDGDLAGVLVARLSVLRSPGTSYWCWGYSFPWQTRSVVVPRGAANLVCTTFVAQALLDLYEVRQQPECMEMAVSAAEYLLNELYWSDGSREAGFGYPLPAVRDQIHNANFLAAAVLCRVARLTGEKRFLAPALRVARCSATRQRVDGSWPYGETKSKQWVDNFHTGYNLCALRSIARNGNTAEFDDCIKRGMTFYRAHFFREDGAARYFHRQTYPIDIHCIAQSIVTLVQLRDLDAGNLRQAYTVFQWAMKHMWDEKGFFYYRMLRLGTVRTSYMRWSQAWMCLALSELLRATQIPGLHSFKGESAVVA